MCLSFTLINLLAANFLVFRFGKKVRFLGFKVFCKKPNFFFSQKPRFLGFLKSDSEIKFSHTEKQEET